MTFAPDRRRPLAWLGGLLLLGLLAGCGPAQVKVEGQFPEPLMEPLPLTVGIWYNEDFANHEFFDQAKSRNESSWVVKTGEAQVQYFGDPSTLQLIKTGREVLRGDRLTKYEGDATYRDLKPILVKGDMRGTIIDLH